MMQYSGKRPVKIRGNPQDITSYIKILNQTICDLKTQMSHQASSKQVLVDENNILRGKIEAMVKEEERKTLEQFKVKNAVRRLKSEQIRNHLGHEYETDEDE